MIAADSGVAHMKRPTGFHVRSAAEARVSLQQGGIEVDAGIGIDNKTSTESSTVLADDRVVDRCDPGRDVDSAAKGGLYFIVINYHLVERHSPFAVDPSASAGASSHREIARDEATSHGKTCTWPHSNPASLSHSSAAIDRISEGIAISHSDIY